MSDFYVTHFISQTDIVTATLLHSINHTDEFNWLFIKLILSFYKHFSSSFFGWGGGGGGVEGVRAWRPPNPHPHTPSHMKLMSFSTKMFLSQRTIQSNRIYLYIYIYAELLFKWCAKLWTEYDINQVTTFIMT